MPNNRYEIYLYNHTISNFSNVFFSSTCSTSSSDKNQQEYTSNDSIWLPFLNAMESKDIEFLKNNSLDSLTCFDCNIDINNSQEYFDADFLLKNHLDKVMHLPSLIDKEFSVYKVKNDLLKIGYTIKAPKAPEGAYNLFFTLVKKGDRYYFQGMMVQ